MKKLFSQVFVLSELRNIYGVFASGEISMTGDLTLRKRRVKAIRLCALIF